MNFNVLDANNVEIRSCEKIKEEVFSIPETVEYDGIKYTVTGLDENSLCNQVFIKTIYLPSTITEIGDNAFYGCKRLTEVHLGGNTPAKGGLSAFGGCSSELTFYVPKGSKEAYEASKDWVGGKFVE